ncbi:camphor resistance protein CrcB [Thioalkalivibrio sp. ALE21]|nr:camphor resistance protein CrcB [Thioalkalivibrio sp. ALE21]
MVGLRAGRWLDSAMAGPENDSMIMWWQVLLLVGAGGALGGLTRFWLVQWIDNRTGGGRFPWGTLAVNVSGALMIGLALGRVSGPALTSWLWLLLVVGVLGSFTTVSSFSLQVVGVAERDGLRPAVLYILLTLAGGLTLVSLGYGLARAAGGAA